MLKEDGSISCKSIHVCLAAAALLALACTHAKPSSQSGPLINLSSETWSFGTVKRGETVTSSLTVTNTGTDSLRISLYSTCDCLRADAGALTIAPGSRTSISLSYTGDEISDKTTKTVFIDSNDERNPRSAVTVTGSVQPGDLPHLSVAPNPILLDPTDPVYPSVFLTVTNRGKQRLNITEVRCFGCVGGWSETSLEGGQQTRLVIESLPGWPEKRWIEIESNDPVYPLKKIGMVELE